MFLKKRIIVLLLSGLLFNGCGSDESNNSTKKLDEVDLSKYSSIYVYKNATSSLLEELKSINKDNNNFDFSEDIFSCKELIGYLEVSKEDIKKYLDQLKDKDLVVGNIVAVYTTLNFDNICMEIDSSNSKNEGDKSATLYWNR